MIDNPLKNSCKIALCDNKILSPTVIMRLLFATSLICSTIAFAGSPEHTLHYTKPATNWQTEALPIGNGNLGAMVFGGIEQAHFMLNEDSVWIGDESDTGSYQALSDLYVNLHPPKGSVSISSTSHPGQVGEALAQVNDGDSGTKWCFLHHGKDIVTHLHYTGNLAPLTSYTLTSANDVPERDPSNWTLEGSQDGAKWTIIDTRKNQAQWEKRNSPKTFKVDNRVAYEHYRFTFKASEKVPHFQLAEISTDVLTPEADKDRAYRRELDISKAIHRTSYTYEGTKFQREAFASNPAGVMVYRFTADKMAAHSGSIELKDAHKAPTIINGDTLIASGNLRGYKYNQGYRADTDVYGLYLDYETQIKVLHDGGTIWVKGGKLHFDQCNSLTILVAADTNYVNQRSKGWKGSHPHEKLTEQIRKASYQSYEALEKAHIKDYQKLYERFAIDLPRNHNSNLPTDQRLEIYQKDPSDKSLEALQLHYARYLMIACSRPGSLPANLQGLWNESNNPPWRCDYHSDVNIQMNYWFVDQTNLSECFEPLASYQASVREVRRENTRKKFGENIRGWATRSENGIFGGSSYLWVPGDAAWLAQNIWDHYAYTKDKTYLKEVAYPILKELCQFWEDYAITTPDGKLISPPSVSPEHGPKVAGNSYEDQLMYDLFTNYIEASKDLGIDADYRQKVTEMRSKLLGPQIGRWGQLQEWMEDIDDPKNQHRHVSNLIAVYPGRQISPLTTPELAKAAATSLDARGDSGTGWSIGWKINLWARLYNGDRAYSILQNSLKISRTTKIIMNFAGGTYHNLLMAHPPFQIEANFGYASGFCELLMQSHLEEIHLLPALPSAWPDGSIKGLKARGNHLVDITWKDGKLQNAIIISPKGITPKVRVGNTLIDPTKDPRVTLKH